MEIYWNIRFTKVRFTVQRADFLDRREVVRVEKVDRSERGERGKRWERGVRGEEWCVE